MYASPPAWLWASFEGRLPWSPNPVFHSVESLQGAVALPLQHAVSRTTQARIHGGQSKETQWFQSWNCNYNLTGMFRGRLCQYEQRIVSYSQWAGHASNGIVHANCGQLTEAIVGVSVWCHLGAVILILTWFPNFFGSDSVLTGYLWSPFVFPDKSAHRESWGRQVYISLQTNTLAFRFEHLSSGLRMGVRPSVMHLFLGDGQIRPLRCQDEAQTWRGVNSARNSTLGGVWEVGLLVFLWR